MNHDAHALPDVSWAENYDGHEYAAHILARIANAMAETMNDIGLRRMYVKDSLALTRQWRQTLPPSERISHRDIGGTSERGRLRAAIRTVIDADGYLEGGQSEQAAFALRWAEANLRTWLKGQTP